MPSATIGMLSICGALKSAGLRMAKPAREIERDQNLLTGLAARLACRRGSLRVTTAGIAPGYVQGNLAVLPQNLAADFLRFCQANPKPCPLIGVSDVGNPHIPALGLDLDIRTDLPGYRVWQDGELVEETADVTKWWREDLVSFVIGCSYSFEESLIEEGIPLRHVEQRLRVPMYRTNINCTPASAFSGPMVVSMRPLRPQHAIRAIQITSRFPAVHGAPVHVGLPELIGIKNLAMPDYGDPVEVRNRRASGVLGLRSHAPVGHRAHQAAVRDHARAGRDADHRPQEPAVRGDIEKENQSLDSGAKAAGQHPRSRRQSTGA